MRIAVKAGATGRSVFLYARSRHAVGPKTGLSAGSPGLRAAYVRDDGVARRIELRDGEEPDWRPGTLAEVDDELLPGVYRFDLPDQVLAEGATLAVVVVQAEGALVDPVEIALVGYDPQDSVRLGMSALSPEARVAALHGAFPRLAAREMHDDAALRERDPDE